MKVKIEISICTGLMLNDHSNTCNHIIFDKPCSIPVLDKYFFKRVRGLEARLTCTCTLYMLTLSVGGQQMLMEYRSRLAPSTFS